MTTPNSTTKTQVDLPSDNEIRVTRTFSASQAIMWDMWTKPEHLAHWWGLEGWTLPVCEMDFREGGSCFYCMKGPDMESCGKWMYQEIVPKSKIVHTDAFANADRTINEDYPASEITLTFNEKDGKTTVVSVSKYASKELRDQILEMGVEAGISQTYDRLET
ncbi:MAG: SRPBCC domain-containing protein, partial [Chloroflexota bacterium]